MAELPPNRSRPIASTDRLPSTSLQSIKTHSKAKDEEEKIKAKRKRGIIVQMLQFLTENGFGRTLDSLQQETGVTLQKHSPADNIDMMTIFQQYEEYYDFKFGKKPKFFRAVEDGDSNANSLNFGVPAGEQMMTKKRSSSSNNMSGGGRPPQHPSTPPVEGGGPSKASGQRNPANNPMPGAHQMGGLQGGKISSSSPSGGGNPRGNIASAPAGGMNNGGGADAGGPPINLQAKGGAIPIRKPGEGGDGDDGDEKMPFEGRLALKPLPNFGTSELNELAQVIFRDILDHNPAISWNDIAELGAVKALLKEAVVMPIKYPQLFSGIVRPWHGILLFGPPGTGKTMMAKAVATECRTTFFNVSASTIVSKWRGDSEKLVRMLFDLAVHYAPSTIFIDELDSIMSARSSDGSEHEGSRRMKTELLIQMDGLSKRKNGDIVFVMAASNVPWDLDGAMLRRLEKRICVGLPSSAARKHMFKSNLASVSPDFDFDLVAQMTEGHSGADIDVICREATMRTIRILIHKLETQKKLPEEALERPQVTTDDVRAAIKVTRTSANNLDPRKYSEWERQHGSTISTAELEAASNGVGGSSTTGFGLSKSGHSAVLEEALKH